MTDEPERARDFFARTLDWSFQQVRSGGEQYWMATADDSPVGGIIGTEAGTGSHWFPLIAVDDVDARVARVAAAGGSVSRPPFDVEGSGRIAIVRDPNGTEVGWITPAASAA